MHHLKLKFLRVENGKCSIGRRSWRERLPGAVQCRKKKFLLQSQLEEGAFKEGYDTCTLSSITMDSCFRQEAGSSAATSSETSPSSEQAPPAPAVLPPPAPSRTSPLPPARQPSPPARQAAPTVTAPHAPVAGKNCLLLFYIDGMLNGMQAGVHDLKSVYQVYPVQDLPHRCRSFEPGVNITR